MLIRIAAERVLVAAENIDRVAADAQTRPGDRAAVDGVAHGRIRGASAFGPHVAFGRKAGHEIVSRGDRRTDRAFGNGFIERLRVFRAWMQEQMHVRVDQSRHQRAVAQIDRLRVVRMINMTADRDDALAADQHFARRKDFAAVHIEQARGV